MTKKHFIRAAEIVRAIRDGNWTSEPPIWAKTWRDVSKVGSEPHYDSSGFISEAVSTYTRAVQTAEAFIVLATEFNPRFDTQRFLVACGLVETPIKPGKRNAKVV